MTSEDLIPLLQVSENSFETHFAFCLPNQEHLVVLDTVQWPNLSRPFRFWLTLQVVAAFWHVPPIVRSACSSQTQARVWICPIASWTQSFESPLFLEVSLALTSFDCFPAPIIDAALLFGFRRMRFAEPNLLAWTLMPLTAFLSSLSLPATV